MKKFSLFNQSVLVLTCLFSFPILAFQDEQCSDQTVLRTKKECVKQKIRTRSAHHPYANQTATVRVGTDLCREETEFLAQRLPHVKTALEQALNISLQDNEVPSIAICASGGGYRAMLSTLGSFKQSERKRGFFSSLAHYILDAFNTFDQSETHAINPIDFDLGLLDMCTYSAGVSGSCWANAGLLYSRMSVKQYLDHLTTNIDKHLLEDFDIDEVMICLLKKYSYDQPLTLIDLYGALLAQTLLEKIDYENPCEIPLPSQKALVKTGHIPLPIYSSVLGRNTEDHEWVEFTPYEVGSTYLNAYIPSWAFGRKFDNGVSQDCAPPQSLGYCMGIWGSAMSVSIREIFNIITTPAGSLIEQALAQTNADAETGQAILQDIQTQVRQGIDLTTLKHPSDTKDLLNYRLSPARVFNWTLNLPQTQLSNTEQLTLVDAGIDVNIPLPPLLDGRRKIDIIIVLDASSDPFGTTLFTAEQYARERNMKFPVINYRQVNNICSVHRDNDPETPVVIYLPLMSNSGYQNGWNPREESFTSSFDFKYTPEEVYLLSGLTHYNMLASKALILQTIKEFIQDKRS